MSGSAANASARRRRATNAEEESTNIQDNNKSEKKGISPLQILQAHEHRLKKLEEKKEIISYNDNNEKNVSVITNDIETKIKTDLELLSNNNKLIEEQTKNELSILSEKIEVLINENISLKNEINELKDIKLLVIKTQALGLETSKDMYDIKSELTNINKIIEDNKNFENNKEQYMMNNDENSGLDFIKNILMSKIANNYEEKEDLIEETNINISKPDNLNINISESDNLNVDITNEINDLSELNEEDNELFNKIKDLTENMNLIQDNNELEDISKNMIHEEVLKEITEALNAMNDNIENEESLDQRIDDIEEVQQVEQ